MMCFASKNHHDHQIQLIAPFCHHILEQYARNLDRRQIRNNADMVIRYRFGKKLDINVAGAQKR